MFAIFPYLGEKILGVDFVPNFITPKVFVVNVVAANLNPLLYVT